MSQIRRKPLLLPALLLLSVLFLAGCGSSNSESSLDLVTGKHPVGWLPAGHMVEAKVHVENCAQCHGADYSGGISKVACTDCHIGNQQSIHPASWGPRHILHAAYVKTNGNSACANALCHGASLDGAGGTGPSCTSCHMGGINSKHPVGWNADVLLHGNFVRSSGTSSCRNVTCHGANLEGVANSGVACAECHATAIGW
jgi:hypothetical protein